MLTNILELELDGEEAGKNWSVFEMREGDSKVFDSPLSLELPAAPFPIAGVAYCARPARRVLVATEPTVTRGDLLAFARDKALDVTCKQLDWSVLAADSPRDCLRLLWSMLGQREGCQNVAGKLFVNVAGEKAWKPRYVGDKKDKDKRGEAVFMEVCIGNSCELTLVVRTFTKKELLYKEHGLWKYGSKEEKKERLELLDSLTRYKISGNRALSAARGDDGEGDLYLQRKLMAVKGQRNTVDYNSHVAESRNNTKTGVAMDILALFHAFHCPYAKLSFKEMPESGRIATYRPTARVARAKEAALPEAASAMEWRPDELPLRLVCADGCEDLMADISGYLERKKIPVSAGEGRLSLCCVPRREDVEGEDDPYARLAPFPAQHVTEEILGSIAYKRGMPHEADNIASWAGLETSLKELRIKGDIAAGGIRLYDWARRGPEETVAFASVSETDKRGRPVAYGLVKVSPEGAVSFEAMDNLYCGEDPFINDALYALQAEREGAWCCVAPSIGCAVGTETPLTTMPDIDAMREYLRKAAAGEDVPTERSTETLMALYGDTFDIAWAEEAGGTSALYYAADCHNANVKRARATRLRRVRTLDGAPVAPWMALLMPLLDVWFVKMRESTVRPFPLKYLDEWLRADGQVRPS